MRFDALNLFELCPTGIPINTSPYTVKRRAINAYYLNAFGAWYASVQAFVMAAQAPYSIEACQACTDRALKQFIEERGLVYYASNTHVINAAFVWHLYTQPFGSAGWVDAITKYACNNADVVGTAEYDGCLPYHFLIGISGDLTAGEITEAVVARLNANIDALAPAHVQLEGFAFTDLDTVTAFAGVDCTDVARSANVDYSEARVGWFARDHRDLAVASGSLYAMNGNDYAYAMPVTSTSTSRFTILAVQDAAGNDAGADLSTCTLRIASTTNKSLRYVVPPVAGRPIIAAKMIYKINL